MFRRWLPSVVPLSVKWWGDQRELWKIEKAADFWIHRQSHRSRRAPVWKLRANRFSFLKRVNNERLAEAGAAEPGVMEAVSTEVGYPPPPGEDRWEELCSMEAALEAEVSELRLTVASPTSMTVDGGRSAEAEHERDENASPSRAVRSDAYWGSRGPRPVVRRADVAGVAPVREEETTRSDTTSCNASHPSRRFRARRGEAAETRARPSLKRPAMHLRSSRDRNGAASTMTTACACLVTTLRTSCLRTSLIEGESKPRRRSNEGAQHATPAD